MLDRNGLMGIELLDAANAESAPQPVINARWKRGVVGGAGRKDTGCRDPAVGSVRSLAQAWAPTVPACQTIEHRLKLRVPAARLSTPPHWRSRRRRGTLVMACDRHFVGGIGPALRRHDSDDGKRKKGKGPPEN